LIRPNIDFRCWPQKPVRGGAAIWPLSVEHWTVGERGRYPPLLRNADLEGPDQLTGTFGGGSAGARDEIAAWKVAPDRGNELVDKLDGIGARNRCACQAIMAHLPIDALR
jgi:hypothetical protein